MKKEDIIKIVPIEKGWSGDKKYCVTLKDGEKFLLRLSPAEKEERINRYFGLMKKVEELDIPMCRAIETGRYGDEIYFLQSWIDGVDMEEYVHGIDEEKQYGYGCEAGRILKKLHTIPAPENAGEWEVNFNNKIDRKIKMYSECHLKYDVDKPFLEYLSQNRHLLKDRPQTYQHGDYHIGNMMAGNDGRLYIIDFDRDDFGDPWEEFNRIVWCAQKCPLFASGMVDGYFDGEVPMLFWKLLALYISSNTLSSLPWAVPFGEGEIATMKKQAKDILRWYDNMNNVVPEWYSKIPKNQITP